MESLKKTSLVAGVQLHASIAGHSKIDFDRNRINKELRTQGRLIQRRARRKVARRATSNAGEYPGKVSGALQRAIDLVRPKSKVGFWIKVEPTTAKIKRTGKIYYPAVLYFGSKKRGIEPRDNYVADALEDESDHVQTAMQRALVEALVPR